MSEQKSFLWECEVYDKMLAFHLPPVLRFIVFGLNLSDAKIQAENRTKLFKTKKRFQLQLQNVR